MNQIPFEYTGMSNLEVMQEAVKYNSFLASLILNRTTQSTPQKMLDVGAGIGVIAELMRNAGHSVSCMEPDEQQANILTAKGFEVYTSLEDVPNETFDWVYAFNVLEHVADDEQALVEWSAKLKSGDESRLLIYVPAFDILFSSMDYKVGHFRRYRKQELTTKILNAELIPAVKARYADCLGFMASLIYKLMDNNGDINRKSLIFYDRYCFPLSKIGDLFFRKLFGKNVFIIARKSSKTNNK
ncbi:MAG: class I SAM-dependent methyltransferase [Prevotellaceae bacterium]|nr:class I SAM-dependent methyltransferase [Prevotellaceae bacterium]